MLTKCSPILPEGVEVKQIMGKVQEQYEAATSAEE
jgi:hypothetical protein